MRNGITFFYGYPIYEEINDSIHERAVSDNETFNQAMIKFFNEIVKQSQIDLDDGRCYFDLLLSEKLKGKILLPKIKADTYQKNKIKLPKFTFTSHNVIQKVQKKSFYLSGELATHIGIGFGYSYGFEYIGYKRVKING